MKIRAIRRRQNRRTLINIRRDYPTWFSETLNVLDKNDGMVKSVGVVKDILMHRLSGFNSESSKEGVMS